MQVVERVEVDLEGCGVDNDPDRPAGLHLSDVIAYLSATIGLYDAYKRDADNINQYRLKVHQGNAWDFYLERHLLKRIDPNAIGHFKLFLDGIHMTPDGATHLEIDGAEEAAIIEFKHTYFSARKDVEEAVPWWAWRAQVMAYCYAWDVLITVFYTLHPCGFYAPPRPLLERRLLRFTPEELAGNWKMIQTNKEAAAEWIAAGGKSDIFR